DSRAIGDVMWELAEPLLRRCEKAVAKRQKAAALGGGFTCPLAGWVYPLPGHEDERREDKGPQARHRAAPPAQRVGVPGRGTARGRAGGVGRAGADGDPVSSDRPGAGP